jgi:hypothetical protein
MSEEFEATAGPWLRTAIERLEREKAEELRAQERPAIHVKALPEWLREKRCLCSAKYQGVQRFWLGSKCMDTYTWNAKAKVV